MKAFFILLFLLILKTLCFAQTDTLSCESIFKETDYYERQGILFRFERTVDFADKRMNWQNLIDTLTFKDTTGNKDTNLPGIGSMRFVIRKNGAVDCVVILKGGIRTDIDNQAIERLKSIRFTPAMQNGNPVSTDTIIKYSLVK